MNELRVFLDVLPPNLLRPSLSIDDDGEVCLDWYVLENNFISISFGIDCRYSYAYHIGNDRQGGYGYTNELIPEGLKAALLRVGRLQNDLQNLLRKG